MSAPNSQTSVFTDSESAHLKRLQARCDFLTERLKDVSPGRAALEATQELRAIGWAMDTVKILLTEAREEQSGPSGRDDVLEEAAKVCDAYSSKKWQEYKQGHGEGRANPHWQGQSDGGDDCAEAIRALKNAAPQAGEGTYGTAGAGKPTDTPPARASSEAGDRSDK